MLADSAFCSALGGLEAPIDRFAVSLLNTWLAMRRQRYFMVVEPDPAGFELPRGLFSSPEFIRDAKVLIGVPEELLAELYSRLDEITFHGLDTIVSCADSVQNREQRTALRNALQSLPQLLERSGLSLEKYTASIRELVSEELKDHFSESERAVLANLLIKLSKPTEGMKRQRKAERISREIGATLKDFEILTDMRPVFDDARQTIDGFAVVTTAVLRIRDQGLPSELTVHLTTEQLEDIATKIKLAQQKINVATKYLTDRNAPVADADSNGEED
jgi:hypothetical protein